MVRTDWEKVQNSLEWNSRNRSKYLLEPLPKNSLSQNVLECPIQMHHCPNGLVSSFFIRVQICTLLKNHEFPASILLFSYNFKSVLLVHATIYLTMSVRRSLITSSFCSFYWFELFLDHFLNFCVFIKFLTFCFYLFVVFIYFSFPFVVFISFFRVFHIFYDIQPQFRSAKFLIL